MSVLTRRANRSLSKLISEKRVFFQSSSGTSYMRLTPLTQVGAIALALATAGWMTFTSATMMLDHIGTAGEVEPAAALTGAVQARLDELTSERDQRAAEARSAQNRFRAAMERLGQQQMEMLRSAEEKRELAAALDVMQQRLSDLAGQRDHARAEAEALRLQVAEVTDSLDATTAGGHAETLERVSLALTEAVRARDEATVERETLAALLDDMELRLATMERQNEEMVAELEYAVQTSFEPLEGLFEAADLDLDSILARVRRDHSGTGGPAVTMSTRSYAPDGIASRYDELLVDLDRMNMMRIAAGRIPYAMPVVSAHRFTSAFGYRRDPKNGRRRMHGGVDLAAPKGTPIHATADGVVVAAGSQGGYGKLVRIKHDFGFETYYAHNNSIHVKVGDRVSRGDHISDMGATGRVTGVHLHYEVRLNGKPVNPMLYVEAAKDVF